MYLIRALKYILAGFIIVLAIEYVSKCKMPIKDQLTIGAIASITFAFLELYFPTSKNNMYNNYIK